MGRAPDAGEEATAPLMYDVPSGRTDAPAAESDPRMRPERTPMAIIGRYRIVEMDLWDQEDLDLISDLVAGIRARIVRTVRRSSARRRAARYGSALCGSTDHASVLSPDGHRAATNLQEVMAGSLTALPNTI